MIERTNRAGGAALENYFTYRSYSIKRKKREDERDEYENLNE